MNVIVNFAAFGEIVAERARRYLARDWSRHTDAPWICPSMLRALSWVLAARVRVSRDGPRRLQLDVDARTRSDAWDACAELVRHEAEAAELLERFSAEPRPSGPSGEQ